MRPLLLAACLLAPRAAAAEPPLDAALSAAAPALVRIQVVSVDYDDGREVKREAGGSGFVIDPRGYVVTNHHVAGRAARVTCVFADNTRLDAVLVGDDPPTDIAVLRLEGPPGRSYAAARWGDSDRLRVGDTVFAMGSPLTLSQSVTRGIVSNVRMTMPAMLRRMGPFTLEGEDVGSLVLWVGHDAAIFPGNSGGPLVDAAGEVVGVNEVELGLGGAIPADLARQVAEELIARGRVRRSWLGVELQPLLAAPGPARGALVSDVAPGSPAAAAGLRSGDVLTSLAGRPVDARYYEELPAVDLAASSLPVGRPVEAVVRRAGAELRLSLVPAEREPAAFRQRELKAWGMTALDVSSAAAREMRLDGRRGVLVGTVRPGGPCGEAKPDLEPGDLIRSVGGRPTDDVAALARLTGELAAGGAEPVPEAVEFTRRGERLLTVVKVGVRAPPAPAREAAKAWLAAAVQAVTPEMARALGEPALAGVRVTEVYAGTTAEKAGLAVGDVVTAVDGETVEASQPGDEEGFEEMVRRRPIGATAVLSVRRAGRTLALPVALARAPRLDREMARLEDPAFEFSARDLSFYDRARGRLPDGVAGALVTSVEEGGWASVGDLRAGDIVQAVGGAPVADVAALRSVLEALAKARPGRVVVRVLRGVHALYLELEPAWEPGGPAAPGGPP